MEVKPNQICPKCKEGMLVRRESQYGRFLGCSKFPVYSFKAVPSPKMVEKQHYRKLSSIQRQETERVRRIRAIKAGLQS
jgi:ssDNA-binding Zn-finger/Zn-ribbon topoisomerase 1